MANTVEAREAAQEGRTPEVGQIVVGAVMAVSCGILALLSLAMSIDLVTPSRSPDSMGMPEGLLPLIFICPAISCVLFVAALVLGWMTVGAYKARRAHVLGSGTETDANRINGATESQRQEA